MGKLILVTSGKGGAGKSSVACGLGAALCRRGHSVLLVDTDEGLRTLDMMLGLSGSTLFDLGDVLASRCTAEEAAKPAAEPGYERLFVIAAPMRAGVLVPSDGMAAAKLGMAENYDYVLIDSPAGIDVGFFAAADGVRDAVVVVTPDPVCVRISASVREALAAYGARDIRMIINKYSAKLFKSGVVMNIDDIIDGSGIQLAGAVPEDRNIQASAAAGRVLKDGPAARAFDRIAARLDGENIPLAEGEL